MAKRIKKIILAGLLAGVSLYANQIRNIDSKLVQISLKNYQSNILNFPFIIKKAKLVTVNPNDFTIKVSKDNIVVIPNASNPAEVAEIVVWNPNDEPYIIKINLKGLDQVWTFTSNNLENKNPQILKYETNRVDGDIQKIIKTLLNKGEIPGYKKTMVKRQFETPDLIMQKQAIYDGSRYRVEKWYLYNKRNYPLLLDESNFYTQGILAIALESRKLPAHKTEYMIIIIDKASLVRKQ